MESLIEKSKRMLEETPTQFIRYINDKIAWSARLVAILGARGVGKSTLIQQRILLYDDPGTSLYITADDLYFSTHTLVDLAETFYKNGGKKLYIDEIHKYKNWAQEIKNIYDLLPKLQVIYTGSSILELEKGGADLSRRKVQYHMYGLSFREYIELSQGIKVPTATLDEVISGKVALPANMQPLPLFKQYLQHGYYPYFQKEEYMQRLNSMINTTLETDIPQFAEMSIATIGKLRKLMYIIAQSTPFKPNIAKIARDINYNRNTLADLFAYLEKAGLINQLRINQYGISSLGKVDKVYLENPNLAYSLSDSTPEIGNIRETFFINATRVNYDPMSSKAGDIIVDGKTFEVGGKNKTHKQIQGVPDSYVVRDDIEYQALTTIPLWAFGFLY